MSGRAGKWIGIITLTLASVSAGGAATRAEEKSLKRAGIPAAEFPHGFFIFG